MVILLWLYNFNWKKKFISVFELNVIMYLIVNICLFLFRLIGDEVKFLDN